MATSLERQQQQLNKLNAELSNLKKQRSIAEQQSEGGLFNKPDVNTPEGKKLLAAFKEASRLVIAKQAEVDALDKTIKAAKTKSKVVSDVGSRDEALKAAAAAMSVEEYRAKTAADLKRIQDEQNAAAGTPKQIDTGNVPLEDFIKNLDIASAETINGIKKDLGIKKLDGVLDFATISAIYAKEQEIETVADATGRAVDRLSYYKSTVKAGGAGVVPYGTISSVTEAAAKINDVWQAELGRDASDEEIKKYTPILNEAERKNLTKTVNGITTGGLNKIEFLSQIVKKLPEFTVKKSDKIVDAKAKLTATALANGFNIDSDFSDDLPVWLDAIDKGQKVDKFQQSIRNAARRLLPEGVRNQIDPDEDLSTTFSTYRSKYAKSRGVPANTVSLEKIIPMAITDKGFATNREFDINNRKQPDWDNSEEAIATAYDAVNNIKANWGF
jgi:hypothetical protein